MQGFEYFDSYYKKRRTNYLFLIPIFIWFLFLFGIMSEYIRSSSVFLIIPIFIFFISAIFLLFIWLYPLKFRREQKIIAQQYNIEPTPFDVLKQENDFLMEKDEIKVRFFPAVWYSSDRHHLDNPDLIEGFDFPSVHRISILVTNKRIIIPVAKNLVIKDISIWFPNKIIERSGKIRFVFSSLNKGEHPMDKAAAGYRMKSGLKFMKNYYVKSSLNKTASQADTTHQGLWCEKLVLEYLDTNNNQVNILKQTSTPIKYVDDKEILQSNGILAKYGRDVFEAVSISDKKLDTKEVVLVLGVFINLFPNNFEEFKNIIEKAQKE